MSKFTELGSITDLSKFNLEELKNYLSRWHFEVIDKNADFWDVRFAEKVVFIELRFTANGEFVKILQEEWKGLAVFDFRNFENSRFKK